MRGNTQACLGLAGRGEWQICHSRHKQLGAGCGWLGAGGRAKSDKSCENGLPNLEWQHRLNQRGGEQEEKGPRGRSVLASNLGELIKCVLVL